MKKLVLILVIAAIAITIGLMIPRAKSPTKPVNFTAIGNVVMNNPGLKPNIWYLVYEKNGAPALKVELAFDNIRDEHDLQQGQIVAIEGFEENGLVTVSKTTLLNIQ